MASSAFESIIEKYFRHNGGWLRIKGELAVYYWPRIAGAELAKKVNAIRYRDGGLFLETENPALAHQVTLLSQEIIERYQNVLGRGIIKQIKVKIGTIKRTSEAETPIISAALSTETEESIAACEENISDLRLAETFARFMKKSYQNRERIRAKGGSTCLSCGIVIQKDFPYCPCCENKIRQEIIAYVEFMKKNHPDLTSAQLQTKINEMYNLT